jgi:hypothetical protein
MIFTAKLAPLAFGCALLVAACGGGGGGVAGDTAAGVSSLQVQSKSTGYGFRCQHRCSNVLPNLQIPVFCQRDRR